MTEITAPSDTTRLALLRALGIEMDTLPRDLAATMEALAGEILNLRAERDELLSQLKNAEALADRDTLCPLFNRRAFTRELSREIALSERYGTPLSLIYIDLDRFKLVNDRFGHATGDRVLLHVAQIILENVRQTDIPGRLGGDEFALLLPHAEYADARRKAIDLEQALSGLIVRDSADKTIDPVHVGASCGTVAWRRGLSAEGLIDQADERMFIAKTRRKGHAARG